MNIVAIGLGGASVSIGIAVGSKGITDIFNGVQQIVTGDHYNTATKNVLVGMGVKESTAEFIDTGLSIAGVRYGSFCINASRKGFGDGQ